MKSSTLLSSLQRYRQERRCGLMVLIDPDKAESRSLRQRLHKDVMAYLVGGSLLTHGNVHQTISNIKRLTRKPTFLFPGYALQVEPTADGILLPSLISGRNAEYLIGQHVQAAPAIHQSKMEVIPMGYVLCGSGNISSTQYVTQTMPVPSDKPELVIATAWAGIQLGLKVIYLEAGSGQEHPLNPKLVKEVVQAVSVPVIVGGGIQTPKQVSDLKKAGATAVVIGNILERKPNLLSNMLKALHD